MYVNPNKSYVNPGISVQFSNDLFSETTTAIIFKFHMQHDKTAGLQKNKISTAADNIHKYFFIVFSEKIRLDFSCESSAGQRIHMKNQALFLKDKS